MLRIKTAYILLIRHITGGIKLQKKYIKNSLKRQIILVFTNSSNIPDRMQVHTLHTLQSTICSERRLIKKKRVFTRDSSYFAIL